MIKKQQSIAIESETTSVANLWITFPADYLNPPMYSLPRPNRASAVVNL